MPPSLIPERSASRYAGQYAGSVDPLRMLQIFAESAALALNSKDPETARTRFELALEAYHELNSMQASPDLRLEAQNAILLLAEQFPSKVCLNEAIGLCAKAKKLKTPRRQLEYLQRARDVLRDGLAVGFGSNAEFQGFYSQLLSDLANVEAQSRR